MGEATAEEPGIKPLEWVASSKADLAAFPDTPRREAGFALYMAQIGSRALKAKPLSGFGGSGVLRSWPTTMATYIGQSIQ